jgi:hypothetical protein
MSFNKEDESNQNTNQNEDDFGLPDLDFKPLDSSEDVIPPVTETEPITKQTEPYKSEYVNYTAEDDSKPKAPLFIVLIIGVVVLVAGWLVWKYIVEPSNMKAKQEKMAKANAIKAQEEAAKLAKLKEEEERQRQANEQVANAKPTEGVIEVLSAPSKRYYVVISSAVDGDLVMDNAKKLSAKGVSTKIIPPFGKAKFSRLAIGDYESFAAAQSQADAVKADYGNTVWVIRY